MSSPRETEMKVSISRRAYKMGLRWAHGWTGLLPYNRQGCSEGRPASGEGDNASGGNFKSF